MRFTLARLMLLITAAAAMLALGSRTFIGGWRTVTVSDAAAFEELLLFSDRESVSGVSICIDGELDGTADLVWQDRARDEIELRGRVEIEAYRDHFSRTCRLLYAPRDARSGRLRIAYRFH